jgi:20S proteasome subunit alpha 7
VHLVHDDSSSSTTPFELEMTWIGPQTKGIHEHVPEALLAEAEAAARAALDAGMDED